MILRFVDGIDGSTLLDLNDGTSYYYLDGSEFPLPEVIYEWVENSLVNGRKLANWRLGGNTITLKLLIEGTDHDDKVEKRTALFKQLLAENTLEVRMWNASTSVFYHTYPALPKMPDFTKKFVDDLSYETNISIEIPVDVEVKTSQVELDAIPSLLPNGSFEKRSANDFADYIETQTSNGTVTANTSEFLDGAVSCKLTTTADGGSLAGVEDGDFIAVDESHHHHIQLGAYKHSGTIALTVNVGCYDNNNLLDTLAILADGTPAASTTWEEVANDVIGSISNPWPIGTTKVKCEVYQTGAAGVVSIDNFILADTEYIPGHRLNASFGLVVPEFEGEIPTSMDICVGSVFEALPWTRQTSGTASSLQGISAFDATHAWAVGASGVIRYYNGFSWAGQTSGAGTLYGVFALSSSIVWAVGEGGKIIKTTNGGANWVAHTSGTTEDLYEVYVFDANTVYAVGKNGTILKTTNGGANWVAQTSGTTEHLYGIHALDATHAWAVGWSGTILFSADNGATWTLQTSGTGQILHSVYAADSTHIWVSGAMGTILFSNGSSWVSQAAPTPFAIVDIEGISTTSVWAVAPQGTIIHGVNVGSAIPMTNLIIGQRDLYSDDFAPVREAEGATQTKLYDRSGGYYRAMAAGNTEEWKFNLDSHEGRYLISVNACVSAGTVDQVKLTFQLKTTGGSALTGTKTQTIDLSTASGATAIQYWREIAMLTSRYLPEHFPVFAISAEANKANIDQSILLTAGALGADFLWIDSITIIPIDRAFVEMNTLSANYLIIESSSGNVLTSLDGSLDTAAILDVTTWKPPFQFEADPNGINMTFLASNKTGTTTSTDYQMTPRLSVKIKYNPAYLLPL